MLFSMIDPKLFLRIMNLYWTGYSKSFFSFINTDYRLSQNLYFQR